MIRISAELYNRMISYAVNGFPEEVCGLIGGLAETAGKTVKELYFLENTDHSCTHFSTDAEEQLNAVRAMRKSGYIPLGNFHSHTDTGAYPSAEDIRLAYDKNACYLILSLRGEPVLRAFYIRNGILTEEELIID